ncbi:MAG: nuclease [Alphaproteobacteria bacterium]|nr:MAG: nuclease [Alphaproteobacteria bacterium]
MKLSGWVGLWIISSALAAPAYADPCEAKLPRKVGVVFSGTVRYVGDGDSLCVGQTTDPNEWIEVRVQDFRAPELGKPTGKEARAILVGVALGKPIICTVVKGDTGRTTSWDRVFGRCLVGGVSVGDLMRAKGAPTGGK